LATEAYKRCRTDVTAVERATPVADANVISVAVLRSPMPPTLEVACTSDDCELDMFELHYTYDMPDDVTVADFACPYCGGVESLEEIEV
jgi:hypothetical protein